VDCYKSIISTINSYYFALYWMYTVIILTQAMHHLLQYQPLKKLTKCAITQWRSAVYSANYARLKTREEKCMYRRYQLLNVHNVCGIRITYEYGALVEWYWQGNTKVPGKKTCPSATLSTTDPAYTGLGSNPDLRGVRPATNRLCHGPILKDWKGEYNNVMFISWSK
jgi:hypothetical protein